MLPCSCDNGGVLLAAVTFMALTVAPRDLPPEPSITVVNTASEWDKLTADPLRVDLRRHTVLVVFAGEKPTGGWRVQITGVAKRGSSCVVSYLIKAPPAGAMVTQAFTTPYAAIRLNGKCLTAAAKPPATRHPRM